MVSHQQCARGRRLTIAADHAYFVCEPPGEPYYLARIMEFLHANNDPEARIDAVRVNWYYRPKDIQRRVQDTRVVFASMHSDTCPLTSIRGKCHIQHLSEIENLDHYRTQKDFFWFDKLYDRYMHRYYEVIPTSKVINVPQHVKKVLDERWKFVLVEIGRGRELTSAVKTCKRCSLYAANHDSVDCAVCKNTYHMACIRPPLIKKPARGFAWACAACSRAQELRLEARNTPTLTDSGQNADDEILDEEEDDTGGRDHVTRESSMAPEPHEPPTDEQIAQANLWPFRYLGVHCRVEDALDYDDRIYPRASSRLGPRHQANTNVWHGRPVELVKPSEIKRKYLKTNQPRKDNKLSKETLAALELEKENKLKRPKWVLDEPPGYLARGDDKPLEIKGRQEYTSQLTFRMPQHSDLPTRGGDDDMYNSADAREALVDDYMQKAKAIAPQYGLEDYSVDFLTKALELFQISKYNADEALESLKHLSARQDLKQPELNREEIKRFEEGVAKFGSELHSVARHVGPNMKESRIVRFYYMWKKTERGRQIWGNVEGRKSKKETKRLEKEGQGIKLLDDVADDVDDSAFDSEKAAEKKKGFECKFCATRKSRRWRRAPATAPGTLVPPDAASKNSKDRSDWLTLALCGKCAYLWRRYAIQYESIEEVSKKIAAAGGRASKRKIDEELMRTILEAQNESGDTISATTAAVAASAGVAIPANIIESVEPPRKKPKSDGLDIDDVMVEKKKVVPEKPREPSPLVPEMPRVKVHPCSVCHLVDLPGDELLKCRDCRLHAHRSCYGVHLDSRSKGWLCDMCHNDHNTQVSTTYECVLCPIKSTPQELMEPLKASHKKKTDREREKERLEKEMVQEASRRWRQEQEAAGRPVNPREALKRTAWNNWVHVICAMWTEEIRFGNAELFDAAEGVGFIPRERFEAECKICKLKGEKPTVACFKKTCPNRFHVGCAHQAEYLFGIDIFVPKGTRRDAKPMMRLDGEKGSEFGHATPIILCPSHVPERVIHSMLQATDEGLTALQLYARLYKQADKTVTGTVRRAAQFAHNRSSDGLQNGSGDVAEGVLSNGAVGPSSHFENGVINEEPDSMHSTHALTNGASRKSQSKKCCTCQVDVSPRWWPAPRSQNRSTAFGSNVNGILGSEESTNRNWSPVDTMHSRDVHQPHFGSPNASTHGTNGGNAQPLEANLDREMNGGRSPASRMHGVMGEPEEPAWQCHKCHKRGRPPGLSPVLSQTPRNFPTRERPEPERSYSSTMREQHAPQSSWNTPPVDSIRHSHPDLHTPQYSWPGRTQSQQQPPSPAPIPWTSDPRGSVAPPSAHPSSHPPPPQSTDPYPRSSFASSYSTVPPPSAPPPRAQSNGIHSHQTSPSAFNFNYSHELPPPPPNMSQYNPFGPAPRHGSPPPMAHPQHHQPQQSPNVHERQPSYGAQSHNEHTHPQRPSHSRGPSLDSNPHRSYALVPPSPQSRGQYGVAPGPPPGPPPPSYAPPQPSSTSYPSPVIPRHASYMESQWPAPPPPPPSQPPPSMHHLSQIARSAGEFADSLRRETNALDRPLTSDGGVPAAMQYEHRQNTSRPVDSKHPRSTSLDSSPPFSAPALPTGGPAYHPIPPGDGRPSTPTANMGSMNRGQSAASDNEANRAGSGPGPGNPTYPGMPGARASPQIRSLLN